MPDATRTIEVPLGNGGITLIEAQDAHLAEVNWTRSPLGYAVRGEWTQGAGEEHVLLMHRVILGLDRGNPLQADHVSGDKLDNRRANLRIVTNGENAQNKRARGGSSRYRGVSWNKRRRKWEAFGGLAGRTHCVGMFADEFEAARAAETFRRAHMPFAVHDRTLEPVPVCRCILCR